MTTTDHRTHYLPAEWEAQSGIQLTWPHQDSDWDYILSDVQQCFVRLALAIAQRQPLLILAQNTDEVRTQLGPDAPWANIRLHECPSNDTWARDHGFITVRRDGHWHLLDFTFNGWGLKFASDRDNLICRRMMHDGLLSGTYQNELQFVLEGGSIESDGHGTLLTTSECLLSPNRNPHLTKAQIETYLKHTFHLQQVLWLDHGFLSGDDTDSHIDTLARLCPDDTIVYVQCTDPADMHFDALQKMEAQLRTFRTLDGRPYRLLALPMADEVVIDGERLPATYANFLIMNRAVLYPTYSQPANDQRAAQVLQQAFPGYEIVGIECTTLIRQHGSLHCVTMQFPEGVYRPADEK